MDGDLDWLPVQPDWAERLAHTRSLSPDEALPLFRLLAAARMDFARTLKLDRAIQAQLKQPAELTPVRLALLGSSTLAHLGAAIRVAGLRRGLWIELYEGPYGTYRQELADSVSALHRFGPSAVLLALDARHVVDLERAGGPGHALATMRECWRLAREAFSCAVIQQTLLPIFPPVLGNQEHRLADAAATVVDRVNAGVRSAALDDDVQLLALDAFARAEGVARWHEPALWYRAKQEVHPRFAPLYGDQVGRVLAALLGRAAKCLVLDLDQTLWGGVIGDDGLEGIVLGQSSAVGEAHLELQRYALALKERGVVLAVCSKNSEANALAPFDQHPEMLLRRGDIACFVANWEDKAANLRRIARELNFGLDALVFVDDNPVERGLIRRELPEVNVPEMPPDPAEYVSLLAAAGYFEGLGVTAEDSQRTASYAALAAARRIGDSGTAATTDLDGFLASLQMQLLWSAFDASNRPRITQLINKTNQFNLTGRRMVEAEVVRFASRPGVVTLQLRLRDVYGDHGMVGVVMAERAEVPEESLACCNGDGRAGTGLLITDWLMSCRVLGRQVELATLNVLAEQARARGARRLIGVYVPTPRNGMVADLYARLGFTEVDTMPDGATRWSLDLEGFQPRDTHIACLEAALAPTTAHAGGGGEPVAGTDTVAGLRVK